jgi:hypothetical protein
MATDPTHRHRDVESAPGDSAFLRTFGVAFLALVLGLAALVRITDPLAAFGSGILPPVVSADRDYKAALYRDAERRPEIVVLGSSRVKTLRPACISELTGRAAFNFGVNAGVAEDFVAILRFLRSDSAGTVREILLGADPEAFTGEPGAGRALRTSRILGTYGPERAGPADAPSRGAADLLSIESVAASFRSLRRQLFASAELPQEAIAVDGWQTNPKWDAEIAAGEFVQPVRVSESVVAVSRRYRAGLRLSAVRLQLLEELLQEARVAGVAVTAFIPPVHPDLESNRAAESLPSLTAGMEAVLRDAERRGLLRFVETSGGAGYPNDAGLYYDAVHMMPENGDRLLTWVYRGTEGAGCAV